MTRLNDTKETFGNAMDSAKSTVGSAVDTAKHTMDSAKKGTEHAASVAFSDITNGIRTASEFASRIPGIGLAKALGWMGLSRRRGPLQKIAIFGSGVLVGAGVGIMLAPMSGADLREAFFKRLRGVEKDAEKVASKVKDAVVNAEHKVEDAAGKAKETVVNAATDSNKANNVIDLAEHKAEIMSANAREANYVAEHKADIMSDKARDAIAGAERRRNGASAQGHHRHGARHN